jgi:hypothetical protein
MHDALDAAGSSGPAQVTDETRDATGGVGELDSASRRRRWLAVCSFLVGRGGSRCAINALGGRGNWAGRGKARTLSAAGNQ